MRIAIIGAGFSGLSTAWSLLSLGEKDVTLFDLNGVGGGASGIAAGLLHPYVGMHGRRSLAATEGMSATLALIGEAQKYTSQTILLSKGIIRHTENLEQQRTFISHIAAHGDVEQLSPAEFLIRSGVTVDCPLYLQGLWKAIEERGGKFVKEEVDAISALDRYDQVVIAAGGGVRRFSECSDLPVGVLKGQVLECKGEAPAQSEIGTGYIAAGGSHIYLGSTYERGYVTEGVDFEYAKQEILPKIASFSPDVNRFEIAGCRAALRVTRSGHYAPLAVRLTDRLWALTAMGSRGLLYHAYVGSLLAAAIVKGEAVPKEFQK